MQNKSAFSRRCPSGSGFRPIRLVLATLLFFHLVLLASGVEAVSLRSHNNLNSCGVKARDFLRWYCEDSTFQFPFTMRPHILRSRPLPNPRTHPFQYQASKCCRDGCDPNGYRWMCRAHKIVTKCEANGGSSSACNRELRRSHRVHHL